MNAIVDYRKDYVRVQNPILDVIYGFGEFLGSIEGLYYGMFQRAKVKPLLQNPNQPTQEQSMNG